jgi:uncharacterized membrane protein required for colicin V production
MLILLTIGIMLAVGYAFFLQGLLTAFCMLVNVLLAGLVAFNFYEPIAGELEQPLSGSPVQGYEDWICLIGLFCITLLALRVITNALSTAEPTLNAGVQQGGAVVCGLLAGYLTAGFIVCALQTLPIQEDFLGFSAKVDTVGGLRRFLPPDRVWLAMMQRGSLGSLGSDDPGFDPTGYFELGFLRHRRYGEKREPQRYLGEDIPIERGETRE